MSSNLKELSVFIASPGDLAAERNQFRLTIDSINASAIIRDNYKIIFRAIGWENLPSVTGRRSQSVINTEIDKCDVFVLALHRRWGQETGDSKYSSYTEEEFYRAFDRFKKTNSPEIMVFFKHIEEGQVADPGPQLKKVLDFKKKLRSNHNVLARRFQTEVDFGDEIRRHLSEFASGKYKAIDELLQPVELSDRAMKGLYQSEMELDAQLQKTKNHKKAQKGKKQQLAPDLSMVKAEQEGLALARAATVAAESGNTQDAIILFAKATQDTNNLSILSLAIEFYTQIGDMRSANNLIRRESALTNDRSVAAKRYFSLLPEGFISQLQNQVLHENLKTAPPDIADMIMSIHEEMESKNIWEKFILHLIVKHYSTAEIMAMAEYLSTAEGQSSIQKNPAMMLEAMHFGAYAYERVYAEKVGLEFDETIEDFDHLLLGENV
ncbi:hypothetical protein GCM10028791_20320 [Echinicola sediminis]